MMGWDDSESNVKRMHPYQRGHTLITGFMLKLRKIIETERLVGVVMARLVLLVFSSHDPTTMIRIWTKV
jgi:hypothetical protein